MSKTDRQLGMHRAISRREFVQGTALASLGLVLPSGGRATETGAKVSSSDRPYPPARTGMRGSHSGSFEVAHALAREGRQFADPTDLDERYDLIVVGAGISGLAAAYYYRKRFGPGARILLLDNHDDFGGHARRNEFHQGGEMRLSWGGTMNLEPAQFSAGVNDLLAELGVDLRRLAAGLDFDYGYGGSAGPAIWFDRASYGRDVLVRGFSLRYGEPRLAADKVDQFPLSIEARAALKRFFAADRNLLQGLKRAQVQELLNRTRYTNFLARYGGLPEEAVELFVKTTDGYWGVPAHSLSVAEAMEAGLPAAHLLGGFDEPAREAYRGNVAMFPDGNASIARLLVRALIPGVAPGHGMDDIATARFDYTRLDRPDSAVRLRLESTAVNVANADDGAAVTYVQAGQAARVRSRHCILACYHVMIPYLCPELADAQKQAQRRQVKCPLILTNVLLKSSEAADRLGIAGAYCPGRLHAQTWLVRGVNTGGYRHDRTDSGAVPMMFWGTLAPRRRDVHIHQQRRDSRALLLGLSFEDLEREVRTVLDGMLGPAGFEVANDVLAITVNRWPHGYAYEYLDLWDRDWPPGEAPHEIARRPFGSIAIANADAAASAYTHAAIDEAARAVTELGAG